MFVYYSQVEFCNHMYVFMCSCYSITPLIYQPQWIGSWNPVHRRTENQTLTDLSVKELHPCLKAFTLLCCRMQECTARGHYLMIRLVRQLVTWSLTNTQKPFLHCATYINLPKKGFGIYAIHVKKENLSCSQINK